MFYVDLCFGDGQLNDDDDDDDCSIELMFLTLPYHGSLVHL